MDIVLLPGFMLDAGLWSDMARPLGERHRLFFGDLARYGSIDEMAEGVLASAPDRFVLIGFSMGGYVARTMARMAPNRVQALILIATSARADSAAEADRKTRSVQRVAMQGYSGLNSASALRTLHPSRPSDDPLIERVSAMAKRLGGEVFMRQAAHPRGGDLDRLAEIACPTLIIASTGDRVRSVAEAEELRAGIHQSELIVVDGAGHMVPLEAPEQLARTIDAWIERAL